MTSGRLVLLLALVVPLVAAAPADTVYKWIEPDGSTTFSSTPPPEDGDAAEVEEIPVAAPPSEADRETADRRLRAMQDLAAEMERERRARRATARPPRVTPLPPAAPPAPVPPAAPTGQPLVFDDWWTGDARPNGPVPEPAPASTPQEKKPFFTPAPVPAFH